MQQIRLAIIGCGGMAGGHLNAYLKNWRYGAPGHALTLGSQFAGAGDLANAEDGSSFVDTLL